MINKSLQHLFCVIYVLHASSFIAYADSSRQHDYQIPVDSKPFRLNVKNIEVKCMVFTPDLSECRMSWVYLNTEDGRKFGPLKLWNTLNRGELLQVTSLATLNSVVPGLESTLEGFLGKADPHILLGNIRAFLVHQAFRLGSPTGIPVFSTLRSTLIATIARNINTAEAERIDGLLPRETIEIESSGTWKMSWVEVDELGAVEKMTASGSLQPMMVRKLERELLFGPGTVPVQVLMQEVRVKVMIRRDR